MDMARLGVFGAAMIGAASLQAHRRNCKVPWLAQQALLVVEAFKPNSLQSLSQAQSNLHRKQVTLLFSELNLAGNMLAAGLLGIHSEV
jgi:hypothetical protein